MDDLAARGGRPGARSGAAPCRARVPAPLGSPFVTRGSPPSRAQGTSGVVAVKGDGFWSYINTASIWDPDSAPPPAVVSNGAKIGAAVGASLGGAALLAGAAGAFVLMRRRRRRREEEADAAAHKGAGLFDGKGGRAPWSSYDGAGDSRTGVTNSMGTLGATGATARARVVYGCG